MLRLNYVTGKASRWLELYLLVGVSDLSHAAIFGVVCKSRASAAVTFQLCLRSTAACDFVDAFLPKHGVALAEPSIHVDLLKLKTMKTRQPKRIGES